MPPLKGVNSVNGLNAVPVEVPNVEDHAEGPQLNGSNVRPVNGNTSDNQVLHDQLSVSLSPTDVAVQRMQVQKAAVNIALANLTGNIIECAGKIFANVLKEIDEMIPSQHLQEAQIVAFGIIQKEIEATLNDVRDAVVMSFSALPKEERTEEKKNAVVSQLSEFMNNAKNVVKTAAEAPEKVIDSMIGELMTAAAVLTGVAGLVGITGVIVRVRSDMVKADIAERKTASSSSSSTSEKATEIKKELAKKLKEIQENLQKQDKLREEMEDHADAKADAAHVAIANHIQMKRKEMEKLVSGFDRRWQERFGLQFQMRI